MSSSSGKSFTGMALVVLALFGVGGALVDKYRHADDDQKIVEPLPVKSEQDIAPIQDNGTLVGAIQKPGFVSANLANDGTGTLTGKALRDTSVALELNGKTVKTEHVSKDGDFSIELEQPLAPGKHVLQLKSVVFPQGTPVQSDQQITLNIRKDQAIVVTFLEPGQPPQILQGLEDGQAKGDPSPNNDQAMKKTALPDMPSSAPLSSTAKDQAGDRSGLMTDVAKSVTAPSKADQPNILFKETTYIAAADGETGEVKLSGTAQAGAALNFSIDGTEVGRTVADQSGAWHLTKKQPLSPGAHMLLVEQRNDKGLRIAHAQVPFDRSDAPSKDAPKSAWDRFTGIFKVEQGANGEASKSSSDQSKMAALKKADPDKSASDKAEPMKSGSGKVVDGKLADAAKTPDTSAEKFAFESLSYEVNKAGGLLELSGRGIPGSRIRLFKGVQEIGEVVADGKGIWTFAKPGKMKTGPHLFKAGHVLKSGRIASEARMQYDHVAKIRDVQIAKSGDNRSTPPAKPATDSAAKMMKDRVASYSEPAASGEGADHSTPSGVKPSITTSPKKGQIAQTIAPRSGIKKTAPRRRAHRAQKPRRKMARRSGARRSVKRRSAGRYYLSRKNKARYMAKRKRYPKSRRTPARVRVRKGTTLWGYSEHYYGRGRLYPRIQRANRRRIKNPNKIYSGQRIKVPRLRKIRRKQR